MQGGGSKIERRSFAFDVKESGEPPGTFEGYASVFGVLDHGGDIVKRGAFKRSLRELKDRGKKLKMFYRHSEPIGVFDEVKEDARGLFVSGRPLVEDVTQAREAAALVRAGAIDMLSIGFITREAKPDKDGHRILLDVDLVEASIVPLGMNQEAFITAVKSADELLGSREALEAELAARGFDLEMTVRIADLVSAGFAAKLADDGMLSHFVEAAARAAATLRGGINV